MICKLQKTKGFTLVEIVVVIGILGVLAAIALPSYRSFQKKSDLSNITEELINTLRVAQNKTLVSEGPSQWGVFFDSSATPHQLTLFKGTAYASREQSFDEVHRIPASVEIYEINLGGGQEVVFNRLSGGTYQTGSISLRLIDEPETKTIYIEQSGRVGLLPPTTPSDASRVKDSRHIHFDYSRVIDTGTEKLTLTFEGGINQEILISANLVGGQIYWEGEVEASGQTQKLKIHTHRLNDPINFTQFSIHRDRRYNTKSLSVTISGEVSGDLVVYSTDGLTVTSASIYVSELQWE